MMEAAFIPNAGTTHNIGDFWARQVRELAGKLITRMGESAFDAWAEQLGEMSPRARYDAYRTKYDQLNGMVR